MNELIGKTITALRVNEDQSILAFGHHDGTYTAYETCGDCCSETWFADITGVPALLGAIVIGVECMCLPGVEDGRTRQEAGRVLRCQAAHHQGCGGRRVPQQQQRVLRGRYLGVDRPPAGRHDQHHRRLERVTTPPTTNPAMSRVFLCAASARKMGVSQRRACGRAP